MEQKNLLVRGSAYYMRVRNGVEQHVSACSIGGEDVTGEPCMTAKRGDFPNYDYRLPISEAVCQLERWFGTTMLDRLQHGETLTLAYKHGNPRNVGKAESGTVVYEFAFDISHTKNDFYNASGTNRYKFVFVKV